ncbi:kinase-like domain-containing protein [Lipomyces kononenkoae]|uniref:Kinase-like domain-containing protein n=1 Tax=Lipomyces kononenkoae TaxID=34357 RepID=A0ACC3T9L6_LIPKO
MDSVHNYSEVEFHAEGAFSTIYRGRPIPTSPLSARYSEVALKVSDVFTQRLPHSPVLECRILQTLRHKYVMPLLSAFCDNSNLVLVTPYTPLHFTGDVVTDSATRAKIVRDITSAVAFLHNQGVIHRDIKPQNILLASKSGPAYLSDFGTAWVPAAMKLSQAVLDSQFGQSRLTRLETDVEPANAKVTDVGTGPYRAPELLFGHTAYTECIDLWSWGCVIAELWNKKPIFDDENPESSEISLINTIFRKLGTPNLQTWPEAKQFPAFVHIQFIPYPPQSIDQMLPSAPSEAIEVITGLLQYESKRRITAEKILNMKYLSLAPDNIE